jgi:hypothetical protein
MNNQFDLNKFNSFLQMATQTIACGPECQQNKTADELKNQYLEAETNLTLAEPLYEVARQNYYTYVSGESGYNEMLENELNEEAGLIISRFKEKYDEEISRIQTQLDTYNGVLINFKNVHDLYKKYKQENILLLKKLKEDTNDVLTNERKTYYDYQEIGLLNGYYYYVFLIIYIIVVICYTIFVVIYPSNFSIISRLIILLGFIILPFISTFLLGKIIHLLYWLFGLLPKNVYK